MRKTNKRNWDWLLTNMMHNTGYVIEADEAKQLGETLKTNTTLTKLILGSGKRSKGEKRCMKER